jgi:16S rRNA (guanine966-N2)-methyltransferase
MRIIAGKYRGLRLAGLKGGKLRPTSDQLRETLFDVLGPAIEGSAFLDAYAGSGAVGLEALSRGAAEVVFLEHHRAAVTLIRENLKSLRIEAGFRVIASQALSGFDRLAEEGTHFDYAFLDPPYSEISEYHHALRQLGRSRILRQAAWVIAEHSRFCVLEDEYGALHRTRLIRHGDAQLGFYRLRQAPAAASDG